MKNLFTFLFILLVMLSCSPKRGQQESNLTSTQSPFLWENANFYFLLTDRFQNGDKSNDFPVDRQNDAPLLRSFQGGDLRGIIQKIDEGYFDELGINALWFSPVFEQIHGVSDEGAGETYAYHGYWVKDFTNIDPNWGGMNDLKELVEKAHKRGIRVVLDVIINHTGPVTQKDPVWDNSWVRTSPQCDYQSYDGTVPCTLVKNLPDVRTESNEEVELPKPLIDKWKAEGRYEQEIKELNAFFKKTGLKRTPRNYIIKWLADYVRELGVDGFRVDTVKHVEPDAWGELIKQARIAFQQWKSANPEAVLDDKEFYTVGEVYNYSIENGRMFTMDGGQEKIDYFDQGFDAMINFGLRWQGNEWTMEKIFSDYSNILHKGDLKDRSVLNYISSHDDGSPFDKLREKPFEGANLLFLAPGASQVYYGDETARILEVEGTEGDVNLRSNMNWDDFENDKVQNGYKVVDVFKHYARLGKFKKAHIALGAGIHKMLNEEPYAFSRTYDADGLKDEVVVVVGNSSADIDVSSVFEDGYEVKNYYDGSVATVQGGKVNFETESGLILIAKP